MFQVLSRGSGGGEKVGAMVFEKGMRGKVSKEGVSV